MASPNATTGPDPPTTQPPLSATDDAELDPDIDMAIDPAPPDPENPALDETLPEPREATRKDISLREFLPKMDDYAPIVRSPPPCPLPPSPQFTCSPRPLELDTRRRNPTPPPPRRAPPSHDPAPPRAAPRPRDDQVHR